MPNLNHNITDTKRAREKIKNNKENLEKLVEERTKALRESEEKLKAILTGIEDYITIQNKELDIIWINQPMKDLYGDVIGKKCYNAYRALDVPCPECTAEKVFNEEKRIVSERTTITPDGRRVYSLVTSSPVRDAEGNIVAVMEIAKDITERKNLEMRLKTYTETLEKRIEERTKALNDSEAKLRAILAGIGDYITIQNRELDIIWINQPMIDLYGEEIIGEKCYKAYRALIAPCPECTAEKVFNEEKTVVSERSVILPDGRRGYTLVTSSPLRDADGNIEGVVESISLITERKLAEQEIIKLNEELKHQTLELEAINKELEAFSYSVSHDLRAPLRSIDGFSKALLEDYTDILDMQGKNYLKRVRAASQHMEELINALLELSRVTRSEMSMKPVDLSGIAQTIATDLQKTQPERQVDFVIEPALVANGDERLLQLVLENLLGNAWKFTGKKPLAMIEFGVTEQKGEAVYLLRDNGAGFDNIYADKLFGVFQRLHSPDEFSGIGIGLATVKRIIHRHGGRIWAEGEKEKGATFYFTLI